MKRETLNLKPGTLPLVLLALAVLALYAWNALAPKPPPQPDDIWTRIVAGGEFRIGIDPSFPPFEIDDGKGHLSGLDIALADEMVNAWSRAIGTDIKIRYVYNGFDGLYDALKSDQFDAILSALPYDPTKTQDVRFSHSYFNGGPLVIVRDGDSSVKSYTDLADRRIGVELGSSGDSFARRWQRRLRYDLREFNTPTEALHALRLGQVDGVFTDEIAFVDFEHAEGGVKSVGTPLRSELYVIAVRKDAPTLLAQINTVIDAMKADGRMEQLYERWLVTSAP